MPIKIKLNNGEIIFGKQKRDVKRSEVNPKDLHLFDKFDQNGDTVLSVQEMQIANENLELSSKLNSELENGLFSSFRSKKNEKIEALVSQIGAQNVHAVFAGFQVTSKHSNDTLNEWWSRRVTRRAAYTPLTLPQAIVNSKRIDDDCKKKCLHKILDAVAEASKENKHLDEATKNKYIKDLRAYINNMKFNDNTNADLLNALSYELMPNNGCIQDYKNILNKYGYEPY